MADIHLYRWSSRYLRNYSNGDIIVMAASVDEARRLATEEYNRYDRVRYEWEYYEEFEADSSIASRLEIFQKDIAADPDVVNPAVLFISGSD